MANTKTDGQTSTNKKTADEKKVAPKATKKATSASTKEMLEKHEQMVQFVQNVMSNIEMDLKRAKLIMAKLAAFDPNDPASLELQEETKELMGNQELQTYEEEDVQVVEGIFDGYFMQGSDQKKYPVPLNYASKTKLVPGDALKLKILPDGKFIYKLIRPVERQHIKATLSRTDENKYIAMTDDGKTYFLNQAAVTFFKGKPGDELYVMANADGSGQFAAIEAIIKK